MNRLMSYCLLATMVLLLGCGYTADARQVHRNMLNSRLAEVELKSKVDIEIIQQIGGIFDHYDGREHHVYLLPEDFDRLRARGFSVRWLTEEEIHDGHRPDPDALDEYHENDDIEADFINWQATYPEYFSYDSIGVSEQGRTLWVCKISDSVEIDQQEIEVKYVACMHGDELTSLENCMRFIDTLLTGYGNDPDLTTLMEEFEVFIMPLMNPDGRAASSLGQRFNANGVDLNRDFPDRVWDSTNTTAGRAIETAAVMNWTASRNFVLSSNLHGGAYLGNYPWDSNYTGQSIDSPSPEDDTFHQMALAYSQENPTMYNNPYFPPDGTTNGADWYHVAGGMQDWHYVWMGCKEVLFEVSDVKSGPESALDSLWNENFESMVQYLLYAQNGIRGVVSDAVSGEPLEAEIMMESIPYLSFSDSEYGQYYRVSEPGTFDFTFSAPGYIPQTFQDVVIVEGTPTILDVQLSPLVSFTPSAINEPIGPCDTIDVEFTLHNTSGFTLNWQAMELGDPGWRYSMSNETGGPSYNWIDITGVGTELNFTSDDQSINSQPIGFTFPFYGQGFTTYNLSANGYLSFTSTATGQSSYSNTALPNVTRPENMIAPWWDDQSPQRAGAAVYSHSSGDSLVISYIDVESYSLGGEYTYQMILLANGKIVFQYADMGTARLDQATIGMQNDDQSEGLTISYDDGDFIEDDHRIDLCPGNSVEVIPANGSVANNSSDLLTARLYSCCLPEDFYSTALEFSATDETGWTALLPITLEVGGETDPDPVTDLTLIAEGNGVRLSWSPVAGATDYEIWRGDTPDFTTTTGSQIATTNQTTYPVSSLTEEIGFYFVIARR